VRRGGLYPFLRAFATVVTRDLTTQTLIGDLYVGRSVIYDPSLTGSGFGDGPASPGLRRISL
jgi:hypothetical protein